MKSKVLESEVCGIGPPEIFRKWGALAVDLRRDFNYAKDNNRSIEGSYTKSFLRYLINAGEKENLVGFPDLPLVTGSDVLNWSHNSNPSKIITSPDMSCMINHYLLKENKNLTNEEFYKKYFPFIEGCRMVCKNLLKSPSVRLTWNGDFLKQGVENYKSFIDYLKNKADRKDYETNESIKKIW